MKAALLLVALACALAFSFASCVGPKVDGIALFEPAQLAWPEIRADLEAGLAYGVNEGELTVPAAEALRDEAAKLEAALATTNRNTLRLVPWPTLRPWASRGIDAQLARAEIGPGVAESFQESLRNFDELMGRLRGTVTE